MGCPTTFAVSNGSDEARDHNQFLPDEESEQSWEIYVDAMGVLVVFVFACGGRFGQCAKSS